MITETQIKKWNESFKRLSKPEQRVAIAKDVLAQIKAKKYIPYTRDYIRLKFGSPTSGSVQKQFDEINCHVCAIGSLFMSKVKFTNKCDFENIPSGSEQAKQLEKYFSKKDIALMEYVFEDFDLNEEIKYKSYDLGVYQGHSISNEEILRIQKAQTLFKSNTDNEEERLIKMMKHLIKNNGEFVI